MTTIRGYRLHGELQAHNAGFSRWAFCEKDGHEYYIKEFLSPVYPQDTGELSERLVTRKRRLCDDFYAKKRAFYDALARCRTGNNVIVHDFFREGSRFYAVTERIYVSDVSVEDVSRMAPGKRETLVRALLYSVAALHDQRIVHADLKPDNLLLKRTKDGFVTVKIIDFDAGFLAGDVPADLQGDFVYLSPEAFLKLKERPVDITEKIDVFALALLVHQFWTGNLPAFDDKYQYAFQAVLSDEPLVLDDAIPDKLRLVLSQALARNAGDRPRVREMLQCFVEPEVPKTVVVGPSAVIDPVAEPEDEGNLLDHRHGFYVPGDLG